MKAYFLKIGQHIESWTEGYLWFPVMAFLILASTWAVEFLTHRPPAEDMGWLVDYQAVSYKIILIILFTSIYKQATGSWMTLEQKIANPWLAVWSDVKILISTGIWAWLFTH